MPSIFMLNDGSSLVEMTEQPYESEDLLQKLLANHPGVLAGDQFHGAEPKRWLLVRREAGIPKEDAGSDRFSLDHLFVDQLGIPTLVEVKRSSDTRIRREVIGQMFDYAANAVLYWPEQQIRLSYKNNCKIEAKDPDEQLSDFLRLNNDLDTRSEAINRFWIEVDSNLRSGRIRMVFVADKIPPELRRIVEFLNGQMNPAEVLAIEIKKFAGAGVSTLVPTVIGQTAQAVAIRESKTRRAAKWNQEEFLKAIESEKGPDASRLALSLFKWCDESLPENWWGEGTTVGSCVRGVMQLGKKRFLLAIWSTARVEIYFQWLKGYAPFDRETNRMELLRRLNQIAGVNFPSDAIARRPNFDMMLLANGQALEQFYDSIQWAARQIKDVGLA